MDSVITPSDEAPPAVFVAEPQAVAETNRAPAAALIRSGREIRREVRCLGTGGGEIAMVLLPSGGVFLARPPQELPGGRTTEEGWECAQYAAFPDGTGAVLASAWDPADGASCAVYWPGREQDGEFRAGEPQLLDHGPDFYAPALLHAPTAAG